MADSFLERNGTLFQILATVLVAVVGGLIGFWARHRAKPSKTLDYQIIDVPIFSSRVRPNDLNVTYHGYDVIDPRVTRILFENTGTQVIDEDDILEPFIIGRGSAKLLDHNVIDNRNLVAALDAINADEGTVKVYPKTLNAGDRFIVQLIYDSGDTPITLTGRIKGQTSPPKLIQIPADLKIYDKFIEISPIIAGVALCTYWVTATLNKVNQSSMGIYGLSVWLSAGLLGVYTGTKIGPTWASRRFAIEGVNGFGRGIAHVLVLVRP